MKNQTFISLLSAFCLLFTSFTAAWPGAHGIAQPARLEARQDSGSSSARQTASPSATGSADQSATRTQGDSSESASQSGSRSQTGSGTTARATLTTGTGYRNGTRSTAIDPRMPPGGVSMMLPAPTDGMTFVKVGNQVTFKWNYTSLIVTPKYIDVVATNTINHQTYTIAYNQSFQETQAVTWDTDEYTKTASVPFVIATYTLMVYDSSTDPTAVPKAGYLGAFSNLQFGVYTPQPYTPLNDFRCATCSKNSAMSNHEKQALSILLGTCTLTILSFTWFASGVFHLF